MGETSFTSPVPCQACGGRRLRPESLAVKVGGVSVAGVSQLPIEKALRFVDGLKLDDRQQQIAGRLLEEIRKRLRFLVSVGLDYMSLDRSAATLSGGEAQRVRLATQIGSQFAWRALCP